MTSPTYKFPKHGCYVGTEGLSDWQDGSHYPAPVPYTESERVALLHSFQILDTGNEESFDRITNLATKLFHTPMCLVSLIDTGRQWFKSRVGMAAQETSRDLAFCAYAILHDSPDVLLVPDASKDRRFMYNSLVTGETNLRFYAGAPLIMPGGLKLGTLCVLDIVPRGAETFNLVDRMNLVDLAAAVVSEMMLRRRLMQSQLSYISSTAHNLQTPLSCFSLSLMALNKSSVGIANKEVIREAETCISAMEWMIRKALDSSRQQALKSTAPEQIVQVDVRQLVKQCQQILSFIPKSVPATFSVGRSVPAKVWTDRDCLWFCILDLFTNACRFTTEGSIEVTVSMTSRDGCDAIRLAVTDTGSGVEKLIAPLIFRVPFIGSQKKDGIGLGLFFLRTNVDKLGGAYGFGPNPSLACNSPIRTNSLPPLSPMKSSDTVKMAASLDSAKADEKSISERINFIGNVASINTGSSAAESSAKSSLESNLEPSIEPNIEKVRRLSRDNIVNSTVDLMNGVSLIHTHTHKVEASPPIGICIKKDCCSPRKISYPNSNQGKGSLFWVELFNEVPGTEAVAVARARRRNLQKVALSPIRGVIEGVDSDERVRSMSKSYSNGILAKSVSDEAKRLLEQEDESSEIITEDGQLRAETPTLLAGARAETPTLPATPGNMNSETASDRPETLSENRTAPDPARVEHVLTASGVEVASEQPSTCVATRPACPSPTKAKASPRRKWFTKKGVEKSVEQVGENTQIDTTTEVSTLAASPPAPVRKNSTSMLQKAKSFVGLRKKFF